MSSDAHKPPAKDGIAIEGLCKRFGSVRALDDVSFRVPLGSVFGLLGPNGAGKTTLFSIVADFVRPDSGRAKILDIDVRDARSLLGRFSILPQDAEFERNVPVWDQLYYFRRLAGTAPDEARADVERTLGLVGLAEHRRRSIQALSHGMKKRLGIAQAFLGDPDVILLDEPTAGLDPQSVRQIRDLIGQLKSRATVVVSSHNLDEIQELCDHVAILDRGALLAAGPVEELTRSGRELDLELSRALSAEERRELEDVGGVTGVRDRGDARLSLTLDLGNGRDQDAVVAEILRLLMSRDVVPRSLAEGRSLEAEFLRRVSSGAPASEDVPPAA